MGAGLGVGRCVFRWSSSTAGDALDFGAVALHLGLRCDLCRLDRRGIS